MKQLGLPVTSCSEVKASKIQVLIHRFVQPLLLSEAERLGVTPHRRVPKILGLKTALCKIHYWMVSTSFKDLVSTEARTHTKKVIFLTVHAYISRPFDHTCTLQSFLFEFKDIREINSVHVHTNSWKQGNSEKLSKNQRSKKTFNSFVRLPWLNCICNC